MQPTQDDLSHMRAAITASRQAMENGNMPFGAVLVDRDGKVVAHAQNNQITSGDITGHAEVVLIREVSESLGAQALKGATVYASGEPCAMCAGALFWAGVAKLVYAIPTTTINKIGGAPFLSCSAAQALLGASANVLIEGPLLDDEATAVFEEFFHQKKS